MNHNLTLDSYSYEELLGLFELPKNMSLNQLKNAKKRVLMLHPDKSRLPADYFLFYKKAFEFIVQIYENNNKQNQQITEDTTKYSPLDNGLNEATVKKVSTVAGEMNPQDFQNKFNELFENNMAKKPETNKNEWFSKDEAVYKSDAQVSAKNMGQVFETMKQQNAELVRYRGIQEIRSGGGTRLYDDDDEEDGDPYVTSDPFSKLKFDDLRKVHKDQTVFAVSEIDYAKMQRYASLDQLNQIRNENLKPMDKRIAEQQMAQQEALMQQQAAARQHASQLRGMEYEEKNKAVLSNFLRIQG